MHCLLSFKSVGDKTEKQLGGVAEEEDVCQEEVAAKEAVRASVIRCSYQPDCIPFIDCVSHPRSCFDLEQEALVELWALL